MIPITRVGATLDELLAQRGVSRRSFLKFCTAMASMMALPPSAVPAFAQALAGARRPSVIWLSFQECTGCAESLMRSDATTLEQLIFNLVSLDYLDLLQAASGTAAEDARARAMAESYGKYLLLVDGSVSTADGGVYSTAGGKSNHDVLMDAAKGAAAVIAVGTCAAFGGIPKAAPNPTGAVGVSELIKDKPVINISGCPPVPVVLTGVLAQYLAFGRIPDLDALGRPKAFFGDTIHDRCYRRPFYDEGKFAKTFDDEGARNGWCLYELGCKGPTTYNSCATLKWNAGTSFPIQSGHGCLGCSEPDFWDAGSFYNPIPVGAWGSAATVAAAGAAGAALGAGAALLARRHQVEVEKKS
ncbi:MAG: hydrogenase small subunit [Xanthobacteraceae bacterium]|jgi:hydrogenase small subunit